MDCIPLNCKLKWPFPPWSCFLPGVCHGQEKQQRPQRSRGPEKSPQLTCFHKNSFQRHLAKMCGKASLTHKLRLRGFQGGRQKMWGSEDLRGCIAPSSEQLFIHLCGHLKPAKAKLPQEAQQTVQAAARNWRMKREKTSLGPGLTFLCCSRNPGLASLCLSKSRVLGGWQLHMHPWEEENRADQGPALHPCFYGSLAPYPEAWGFDMPIEECWG